MLVADLQYDAHSVSIVRDAMRFTCHIPEPADVKAILIMIGAQCVAVSGAEQQDLARFLVGHELEEVTAQRSHVLVEPDLVSGGSRIYVGAG